MYIPGHKLRPYPGMEMDFLLRLKRTLLHRSLTLPLGTVQWYGGVALLRFCLDHYGSGNTRLNTH